MATRAEAGGSVVIPVAAPVGTPEDLASLAAAGSEEAFEALVRAYQRRVHGFAYRYVHDPHEAQDLAQEIFLRLYSRFGSFQAGRSFEPWFWRLAANVCLNYVRRWRPAPRDCEQPDPAGAAEPVIVGETGLGTAFATLPPRERLMLLLYYHAGMPIEEIAGTLGIGLPALRSRLYRARVQLRRALVAGG